MNIYFSSFPKYLTICLSSIPKYKNISVTSVLKYLNVHLISISEYLNICFSDFWKLFILYICLKYLKYLQEVIFKIVPNYIIWTISDIGYTVLTSYRGYYNQSLRHYWHDTYMAIWLVTTIILLSLGRSFAHFIFVQNMWVHL